MPADIRNFFTPKGGQPPAGKPKPKPTPTPASRRASARKRRVVEDSDDEEEKPAKKITAKKPTPKKNTKENKAEPTTTSSYFQSTGKNKILRTAPLKPKKPESEEENFIDDDDEFDEGIYAEAFKKLEDDYKDDEGEDAKFSFAVVVKKNVPAKPQAKVSPTTKKQKFSPPKDKDVDMDSFVVDDEEEEEDVKPKRRSTATPTTRKRKTAQSYNQYEDDDDDDDEIEQVKPTAKASKPTVKKAKAAPKRPKEMPQESESVRKILDSVPTVRPPSPPPPTDGEPKKFNYRNFMQRQNTGPTAPGSKEIPVGEENCLTGLTFVFTGILESLSREDGQQLVKKYGGKITTAPSSRTSYVVLGNDAGPKKLETIRKLKTKTINEDGLFQLISTLPANGGDSLAAKANEAKKAEEEQKVRELAKEMDKETKSKGKAAIEKEASELWTVKYAPSQLTQICGNKGQVEKLGRWLRNWPKNLKTDFKMRGADGMGGARAVMIYGPPGIGKTTAAHLVAKLEGYDIVESNASDTRSKKFMEEKLRGVLDNRSLLGYFAGDQKKVEQSKQKMVLIMDEVDGMSAGDRGGVGQLAAVCKKTNIPIICICNERKLPKMKPFDNVTYDLPFKRPDAAAIRSRIMSIAYREGLKLPPNVIDQLVLGTHADIRQIINMLSTYSTTQSNMTFDQGRDLAKSWEKHVILKPWDIAQKLLGNELFAPASKKTLNDKIELYFNDHEFSYLMVQENYLKTNPARANDYHGKEKNLKMLELVENASESISDGDLVDALIHGPQQQWSLMPTHGMFSTVKPSSYMYGGYGGQPLGFTLWLGNNSKQGKLSRFVKEIQSHIRLRASGDRHEVRQTYIPAFYNMLAKRLERDGKDAILEVIDTMDDYFLTKDDWDAIVELIVGPASALDIPTQAKSSFTRQYNSMSHPMPFMKSSAVTAPKASKQDVPDLEDAIVESEDEGGDEDAIEKQAKDEQDLSKDKYAKVKKPKAAPKAKAKAKAAPKKNRYDDDDDDDEDDDEDDEPKKKPRAKASAAKGKGKAKGKK
ncbi:DNA replication factor C, large subunit [Choiromyces venosus 120613-1]|uniref:Replication factor C subunit 1 n=1 Tax=Choiromyces venosus 120613-1 TaxID=1336337 RepID=A0A3N4K1T8_9PEZI|nr:DNA replication factor C, large subunit [Choiromyces venosus 120613-1]